MTLLHMDKIGLRATLHVSFPWSKVWERYENVGGAWTPSCWDLQRPWQTWIQIFLCMFEFAYIPLYRIARKKSVVLTAGKKIVYEVRPQTHKQIPKPYSVSRMYFLFEHFSFISWSRFMMGGNILNLELFHFLCVFCMHGLCTAAVTAGEESNPVTHTDSQAALSALCWRCCTLIRLEGQSVLF